MKHLGYFLFLCDFPWLQENAKNRQPAANKQLPAIQRKVKCLRFKVTSCHQHCLMKNISHDALTTQKFAWPWLKNPSILYLQVWIWLKCNWPWRINWNKEWRPPTPVNLCLPFAREPTKCRRSHVHPSRKPSAPERRRLDITRNLMCDDSSQTVWMQSSGLGIRTRRNNRSVLKSECRWKHALSTWNFCAKCLPTQKWRTTEQHRILESIRLTCTLCVCVFLSPAAKEKHETFLDSGVLATWWGNTKFWNW